MKLKYYIWMFAAASLFAACSNDDALAPEQPSATEQQTAVVTEGEGIGFTSTIGDQLEILATEDLDAEASAKTRSTMSDGAFGSWATSDKISISDGTLMYTYQPKEETIKGANCYFQSKTSASFLTDGTGSDREFYAFYPADAVLGWNGTTVSTMIYTEQKYSENVENSGVMGPYMAAVATTTGGGANASFTFGHICSVIDVDFSGFESLTGEVVDAVSLFANSQVSIAGKMIYNVNTKAASVVTNDETGYSNSTQSEMVRVSNIAAAATSARFYVLPVAQANGFTITVHTTSNNYYTKSSSTSVGTSAVNADYLASISGVTSGTACKPYYKKYNFTSATNARTQNWMAMIPGNIKFNHLSLPGTHDAATSSLSGSAYKCQAYTIAQQLSMGCRAFDLRPGYDDSSLNIYHSNGNTNVTLSAALTAIKDFLVANPTETAFVLIHEEYTSLIGSSSHSTTWATRVWNCINGFTDYIASYGWKGNLNPCRGKMVIIFRDNYTDGTGTADLGCGKVGWGGSFQDKSIMTGTGSNSANGTLRYQDEYSTSSSSTKLGNLTTMLNDHIAANETNDGYTFVNNTNIASGTSNVSTLANNVNTAVLGSSTFTSHTGRFGIMMTDFLFSSSYKGDQMFELIHQQNYKYVYKNRTRCSTTSASGTDTGVDISADEYANDGTVYVKGK